MDYILWLHIILYVVCVKNNISTNIILFLLIYYTLQK